MALYYSAQPCRQAEDNPLKRASSRVYPNFQLHMQASTWIKIGVVETMDSDLAEGTVLIRKIFLGANWLLSTSKSPESA